ncbi:WD40 repeat-like protein [Coniophora puteana RWD-64-598 SS2]|uniref:WD40 repeat-like protein n=1 Tax=Coniophora puteana (strain RWD-64-598) TaxID=741705 RepID=A0A5M3MB42_CONPW|nr:WD40 repeat-like protein [Coniophora puteana RWD-64-598 SS2]EIW76277.1 WD40 repeat-like protein [Coniophora puteana RWD-64-598 SS2]
MSRATSSQTDSDKDPLPFTFDRGDDPEPPVIRCIEYSPDGQSIATGASDSTVRLWDAKTGQQTHKLLAGHPVFWLSFSHSGHRLAAICLNTDEKRAHVVIWDMSQDKQESEKLETTYESDGSIAEHGYRVAFSPDDDWVAVMTPSHVVVQETTSGKPVMDVGKARKDYRFMSALSFSSDGRLLFYASLPQNVRDNALVELHSFNMELRQHLPLALSLALPSHSFLYRLPYICSPNGRAIAGPIPQSGFQICDTQTGSVLHAALQGHTENTSSICFSQDGEWVIDGSEASTICIWDVSTGTNVMAPLKDERLQRVTAITCSPLKDRIACVASDTEIHVWDVRTRQIVLPLVRESERQMTPRLRDFAYSDQVKDIHVFPDGRHFVSSTTAFYDAHIHIWDLQTGKQTKAFFFPGGCAVALCANGSLLAAGSTRPFGYVALLDANSGKEYFPPLIRAGSGARKLCFSPDSSVLAVVFDNRTLHLVHDVLGDRVISQIENQEVVDVAFSPDGKQFAYVIHLSGHILLCDVSTMEVAIQLPGPGSELPCNLAFLPDGKFLLETYGRNKARFWNIGTGQTALEHSLSPQSRALTVVSPDGNTFICSWAKGKDGFGLEKLDITSGKRLWSTAKFTSGVTTATFSPAGDKVIVGFEDGTLQVLDASLGQTLILSSDDRSSIELEMPSAPNRSRRIGTGLADWDDDSIMNMPATSSRAARIGLQARNAVRDNQQRHNGKRNAVDDHRGSGLAARLSARLAPKPANPGHAHGQGRLAHAFQLVSTGRAKNRVLAAGEQGGHEHRERHRLHSDDDSTSPSPPESDRAHSPPTRTGESDSSTSSSNWFVDYMCYCVCLPCRGSRGVNPE